MFLLLGLAVSAVPIENAQRDLISTVVGALGLDQVWATIQSLGSQTYLQIVQIGTQLLFAGQTLIAQAKPILSQLVSDLLSHAGDAAPLVQQAIAQLTGLIQGSRSVVMIQRDLISTVVGALGLDQVWATIQSLGSQTYLQIVQIGTQLLFAGQTLIAQAKPILSQLVSDLLSHAGDAAPLVQQAIAQLTGLIQGSRSVVMVQRDLISTVVGALGLDQVWATIQSLGSQTYLQIVQIGTQLLFAGQQLIAQAKPILSQLVSDLLSHAGDAAPLVQQAIAQLTGLIQGSRSVVMVQRDLISTVVGALGLDQVWATIQSLGSQTYLQIVQIGTQLLFAGQQLVEQAKPILSQLVSDLLSHAGDAAPLVQQAIAQLTGLIQG
uniref:MRP motif repeat 4 protein n=1 Tax=Brachionus manjavacas TaxID=667381 RepID=C8CAJ2_9BILA|nr:MRP motif repeat 4 protein precursor [Brachionus manjavacas]